MVAYWVHEKEVLNASKAYQIVFDTINKASDELKQELDPTGSERSNAFRNFVLYLLISPYTNEKVDLMNVTEAMYPRELEKEDHVGKFVRKLLTFELMPIRENEIEGQMKGYDPFQQGVTAHYRTHMLEFLRQLVQHNIRVVQKYYQRITLDRMSQLCCVSVERTEVELSDMVVHKRISAKINRLSGVVVFSARK
jgi:26S proteasome regulatory subunit N5